jgi:hypothetical protein
VALSRCRFGPATNMSLPYEHFSLVVSEPAHKRRTFRRKQRFLMRCTARQEREQLKC